MASSPLARRYLVPILKKRWQVIMSTPQGNFEVDNPDVKPVVLYIDQVKEFTMER